MRKFFTIVASVLTLLFLFIAYSNAGSLNNPPLNVGTSNPGEELYVRGSEFVDGSVRIGIDPLSDAPQSESRFAGVWNPGHFQISQGSLILGQGNRLSAVGTHLVLSETVFQNGHIFLDQDFTDAGTDGPQSATIGPLQIRAIRQSDNSGALTTTDHQSTVNSPDLVISKQLYLQTGATGASADVLVVLTKGVPPGDIKFFEQSLSSASFAADSEVAIDLFPGVELDPGVQINAFITSPQSFTMRYDVSGTFLWFAVDFQTLVHEDLVLAPRVYADEAARDADVAFQIAANIDKVVRVTAPASYFRLSSVSPAVWIETSNGQPLRITDSPTFDDLVLTGDLTVQGTTITTLSGDMDLTTQSGGVFKFTNQSIRAGLDAVEYVEMGHGGGNGFINAVGDGGLDIRFEGATLATFTDFGHLHLQTNVDQKHTLKIITNDNLNDTGLAFENSGGSFTGTIFRTDIGGNRADLVFAGGQDANIDLLTNSFKIHGSAANSGRLEVLGSFQISSGGPGLDKILTSDAAGLATWTEDLGTVVAQETFASTNVRFFGELGPPAAQGYTDTATGSATIDLQTQLVFGESKQVVRHNDNTSNGSTTSKVLLTTQNWLDINVFGASYSGTARLDTVNGAAGFFAGLQANAAENPLATGNRRYGLTFSDSGGNLNVSSAGGGAVVMDGTGGNPLVLFDEFFSWEAVVPAGLGAAELFINKILTTLTPAFNVNTGGLGTQVLLSSGSTGGVSRVTYHDKFGVTIFEEVATKTLLAATMAADVAQINIPEGRRDYTIILPDGNPRAIGATLRLVANNLFGKITLENQDPAVPEILYNGLRTLVIDVFVKEIIKGINTVNQGNVYIGFKAEDIDRSKAIFAQLSSSVDQIPTDTNPTVITYNTQDFLNGIGHSTSLNPGEIEILPGFGGVYFVSPQPQAGKISGGVRVELNLFWQISRGGGGFIDEPNSNVMITIKDADITVSGSSSFTIPLAVGDKIRMMQQVSDSTVGMGLQHTDLVIGPPTLPSTPSIILTMHRVGGI